MERPGRVFSREQLLDGVWGRDIYIDERTVDVHVGRLRKALNRGQRDRPDPHRARRRLFARRPVRPGTELYERYARALLAALASRNDVITPLIGTAASLRAGRDAGW